MTINYSILSALAFAGASYVSDESVALIFAMSAIINPNWAVKA